MRKFAAPFFAVVAASLSLGAAAESFAGSTTGLGSLLHANPDPSVAWPLALGFLGLVVLRRTRSGPMN
jgi:hypothetical protein